MDIKALISKIPILNLLPVLEDMAGRIPQAYQNASDEDKQAMAAGLMKLLASYGKKP